MTIYRLDDAPSHRVDGDDERLSGHYEAVFVTDDGERLTRFLTDKGRAAILRLMDEGRREFSGDELRDFTVEPDMDVLLARTEHEAGEGA